MLSSILYRWITNFPLLNTTFHSPEREHLFLVPDGESQVTCPISWALATLGCLLHFIPCTFILIILNIKTCSGCLRDQICQQNPPPSSFLSQVRHNGTIPLSSEVWPNSCHWPCDAKGQLLHFVVLSHPILFPPPYQCSSQSKPPAWAGKSLLKDGLRRVSSPQVGTCLQPPFPLSAANTPVLAWPRGTGPAEMLAVLSPAVLQPWFLWWDSEGNRSLRFLLLTISNFVWMCFRV